MSLVGASGGVYSIVLAFLANIILNFDVMTVIGKIARIIPIAVFLCLDVGAAVCTPLKKLNQALSEPRFFPHLKFSGNVQISIYINNHRTDYFRY